MTWMQLYSGKALDIDDLLAGKDIPLHIDDIIVPLCRMPRFNGHQFSDFYSIGEHQLLVHRDAREQGANEQTCFWALFHDAHETVTGDIIRPIKEIIGHLIKPVEDAFDNLLLRKMKIDPALIDFDLVKRCDNRVLAFERDRVMGHCERVWAPLPDPPRWSDYALRLLPPRKAYAELSFEIGHQSVKAGANLAWRYS